MVVSKRVDGIKLFLDVELVSKFTDSKLWKKQEDAISMSQSAVETLERFEKAVERELHIARQTLDEQKKKLTAIDLTKNEERPSISSSLVSTPKSEFKRPQEVISTPASNMPILSPNKTSEVYLKPTQTNPNNIWFVFVLDFCSRTFFFQTKRTKLKSRKILIFGII